MNKTWLAIAALLLAGCGIDLYADDGSPNPCQWWPWVCPDGGILGDEGCSAPPQSDGDPGDDASPLRPGQCDGGVDAAANGGCS
ncbi:MAG: hypothetical protein ABTD50_20045 [Polyangiaceae bacterium]